jgi:UDP-N-acetylglucosamine--dolichyl-phosphate N-acetylglucosaminephosphotransferase
MEVLLVALSSLFASFVTSYLITPWIGNKLSQSGITGKDMNKKTRPDIPALGGLAITGGFVAGIVIPIWYNNSISLLAALTAVLIVTLTGLLDDLFQISRKTKALLPVIASIPLIAAKSGISSMAFPIIGMVELGQLYPLLVIPLGMTGASNAVNMLAGLNGLETGLGIIMHGTFVISSLFILGVHPQATNALFISASMLGALLGFLRYNWYPAKVFMGDVGTLQIGAALAAASIVGNMEKLGIILIAPYFIELYLKARTGFKGESFGKLQKDGTLKAPKTLCSLTHIPMKFSRLKEPQIVGTLLAWETIFALIGLWSVITAFS